MRTDGPAGGIPGRAHRPAHGLLLEERLRVNPPTHEKLRSGEHRRRGSQSHL